MSKCKFILTIKGNDIEFDTEEQLNSYLKKNYDILSKGKVVSDMEMSVVLDGKKQNPLEKTTSKLLSLLDKTPVMKTSKFNENGERILISNYKGVISHIKDLAKKGYIKAIYYDENNYIQNRLVQLRTELYNGKGPVDKQNAYRDILGLFSKDLNNLSKEDSEKYGILTKELLMPLIIQEQENRKLLGVFGSNIHKLAESFFNTQLNDEDKSYSIKNFPPEITTLNATGQQHYLNYLNDVSNYMKELYGKDAKIIPEYRIYDEKTKLVGIIDLLVIDSQGKVHIYDFKASYKDPSDWHSAKVIEYQYQLGIYANMLRNKGLDVGDTQILPIQMNDINFEEQTIPSLTEFPPKDINLSASIKYIINEIVPPTSASFYESNSDVTEVITENLKKAWGYNLKLKSSFANVEWFKNKRVTQNALTPGIYTFWDSIKKKMISSTSENLDSNIEEYLKALALASNSEFIRFKQWMGRSIEGKADLIDYQGKNEIGNRNMVNAFNKYTKGGWKLIDDDAGLDNLGIMMFVNTDHNEVEFVSYTVNNLRSKVKLSVGSKVVGNFTTDEEAKELPDVLDATNGNIELLKIYFYMNENAEQFKKYKVGRVMCYNPYDYTFLENDNETLQKNFNYIVKRIGSVNEVKDVETSDKLESLRSQFISILNEEDISKSLKDKINKYLITLGDNNNNTRLERLLIVQKDLHELLAKTNKVNVVNTFWQDEEKLYGLVGEAIIAEMDIKVKTVEQDVAKHGLNSTFGSNPTSQPSENLRTFVAIIKKSMNRLRQRQLDYKSESEPIVDTFLNSKGFTNLRRATVGDNIRAYDNLFEPDENGKINKELILKNPYDKNSALNNDERTFLKYFLKEVNYRRFNTTSLDSDTAKLKIENKEWFKLPLLRASAASKASTFTLKGYRDSVREDWDKYLNTNNLFNESEEKAVTSQSSDMFTMFNEFNFHSSPDSRTKLIEEQSVGSFETNLERVLDNFVFSSIRKQEYDSMLPVANALRTAVAWKAFCSSVEIPHTLEFMDKYAKMAVFNEKDIDPDLQGFYKFVQIIKDITSKMNIGMNPVSGFVNTLQGTWGTVSRIVANKYPNMFGKEEYLWAIKTFCKDTTESISTMSTFQALNRLYGINNMDINILADVSSRNNGGLLNFKSKWLYWMAYAPDYFNRMTIFTAQMKKDGCFEAHRMEGSTLVYDWKIDKRFSEYAAGNTSHPEYNNQLSLYMAMLADFNKEGFNLVKGQDLPYAYTSKQRESLKMFSDSIYGYYDHESKILYNQSILGVLFFQFKTWITAKKDQWVLAPGTYAIGDYKEVVIDGVKKYLDSDNNITDIDTGVPLREMQGDFMEGIYYSLQGIAKDWKDANWSMKGLVDAVKLNEARLSNMKLMIFDLTIVLTTLLVTGMIDWEELKKDDEASYTIYRAILRSSSDLNVINNINTAISPSKSPFSSFSYMGDLIKGIPLVITGDKSVGRYIFDNTGMLRPFATYIPNSSNSE